MQDADLGYNLAGIGDAIAPILERDADAFVRFVFPGAEGVGRAVLQLLPRQQGAGISFVEANTSRPFGTRMTRSHIYNVTGGKTAKLQGFDSINWRGIHRMSILKDRIFRQVLLLCLVIYLFSAKGYIVASDTLYSLATAQSLIDHGRLDIPYAADYTLMSHNGKSYSKYGFGLPMYYIPLVAVSDALSRLTHLPRFDLAGFFISFANIPFALLTLVLFAKLLRLFKVSEVNILLSLLALGLGTLVWGYSGIDPSEEMQMGLLVLAVYGAARGTPRAIVFGGIGFAWLFLVKVVYIVFFPIFLLYLITRPVTWRHRIRNIVLFAFPLFLAGCFDASLNLIRFGNPFESGYGSEANRFLFSQLPQTVPRLLGSLDKGLFIFCPILILGLFGWKRFASRHLSEALLCGSLILVNFFLSAAWWSWMGGWSWGPRLLVPLIPLWLLPAAFWLDRRQSKVYFSVFVVFLFISIIGQIPGVLVRDEEIHEIKANMLTAQEQRDAPSDYVMAPILLRHKLVDHNEVYPVSEFHLPGDREVNMTPKRTFIGLNIWTEEVARQRNMPALRWLPILALLPICYLAIKIGRASKTAT